MLQSCLQLKCDVEDIVDQLEREKWVLEWKKRKDGGKDIANVITGNLSYRLPTLNFKAIPNAIKWPKQSIIGNSECKRV